MKLIADSGGTKTQWCGVTDISESAIISTIGLNPNFVPEETITKIVSEQVLDNLNKDEIYEVWFYGAGCAGEAMGKRVENAIRKAIPAATISVLSDLTGAARGLLGRSAGYVCMIGTGSNSGYFDGEKITKNVPPLGFILGDEGSGAYLGKRILADYLRGIMPANLSDEFRKKYGAGKDEVVSHVYTGVFPSRFIGGFVRFIRENISEEYCLGLVRKSFEEFVQRNLNLYNKKVKTEIAVTGSVAWHFREILEDVLHKNGFVISVIMKEPISGLIKFHRSA
jgi:glucosamine kinase